MSLGKGLLARLHLKVKMYITNLLSGYNLQKISCLKKIFPWPWKLKERFLRFCFFYDLLKLHFFTRCLYFHHSDDEKKEKINSSTIFEEFYLNLKRKFWKFNKQSWLSITWILKKSNSIQTLVDDIPKIKLSHWSLQSKTYTFNNSNSYCLEQIFCFIIIALSLFRLWVRYLESTVAASNSSLAT